MILDNSKLLMYQFAYLELERAYSIPRMQLCFTDTDSLCFLLESDEPDPFKALLPIKHVLETSDFPPTHVLYRPIPNNQKLGLMKVETGHQKIITEFVGLRSKCYDLQTYDFTRKIISENKASKGMPETNKKQLSIKNYIQTILDKKAYKCEIYSLRSYNSQMHTIKSTKQILSSFDVKRYVLDDGIRTLPFSHYSISDIEQHL